MTEVTYTVTGLSLDGKKLMLSVSESPGVLTITTAMQVQLNGTVVTYAYPSLLSWFGSNNPCRLDTTEQGGGAGITSARFGPLA